MAQPDLRLVGASADCEVLSQRIAAFKPDVVGSATGLVAAGKFAMLLAIQAATRCEVVGKVESREDVEGVTKDQSALLITLQSGTKVVLIDLPGLGDDGVPMANVYEMLELATARCKCIDAFLLCHEDLHQPPSIHPCTPIASVIHLSSSPPPSDTKQIQGACTSYV
jgi:hypothetical protein